MKRILVVDDSPPMRAILTAMLRTDKATRWGIAEAGGGSEFLDALALQPQFDSIVLDVQMPDMDGFSACRILRELNRETPVLFVTAEGDPSSYAKGRTAGGDSYLVKPFTPSALRSALSALTSLHRKAS
ncbi:MAG TPA: response regulator [Vicinamibacteria bacterium]|nr:response regulator [Vicinamibacteria bacterium]